MKYILMINVPRGTGDYQSSGWAAADRTANMDYMRALNEQLRASGELVAVEALAPPGQARIVSGSVVTDGPFPEAKEFLAGYWIVDVADEARAHAIATLASLVPGQGGIPLMLPIEVRAVLSIPR